jgi:hypothetical protein
MNQQRLRGYRCLLWVGCPDAFGNTLVSIFKGISVLKIEAKVFLKRRDNLPTPGGDILAQDVLKLRIGHNRTSCINLAKVAHDDLIPR